EPGVAMREHRRIAPHLPGLEEGVAVREQLGRLEARLCRELAERLRLGGEVALQRADGVEIAVGQGLRRRSLAHRLGLDELGSRIAVALYVEVAGRPREYGSSPRGEHSR